MKIKEIISCYVTKEITAPSDMKALRHSFIKSGFKEKVLSSKKTLYKRGASVALEFNYDSQALEVQVIVEEVGEKLKLSVGNWGFPLEPLLMKNRFKRTLSTLTEQIETKGMLSQDASEIRSIKVDAKKKNRSAVIVLPACAVGAIAISVLKNT